VSRFCCSVTANSIFSWIPFLKLNFSKRHARCSGQRWLEVFAKETLHSVDLEIVEKWKLKVLLQRNL
jgi:hypothetical protein